MKKLLLSFVVLGGFSAYAYYQKIAPVKNTSQVIKTPQATSSPKPPVKTPVNDQFPNASPPPTPRGKYADGTYTGPVADAVYGPMQVRVIIQSGKISDVRFLQYPDDRQTSRQINEHAMPILLKEVIKVQSAEVDGVSGATETSAAFIESLKGALKQAI